MICARPSPSSHHAEVRFDGPIPAHPCRARFRHRGQRDAAGRNRPERPLAARIERITSRPEFAHAIWGIEIFDADLGKTLYTVNADKLMFPGSTTKLLSAGTALATFGADHRFHTKV